MTYNKCGKITSTFGIKGQVKIYSYSDFDRFSKDKIIYLNINGEYYEYKIESSFKKDNLYIVKISNINSKEDAIDIVNLFVYAKKDKKMLKKDEYYYNDLIGMKVVDKNDNYLGDVINLRRTINNDILEVSVSGKIKLIPFNKYFIIDIQDDKITINNIEGLI